ncbi:DUF362 domain-containing protein, partial [Candidatus Dependentiae bacterium]|nr:DUF362 domain-containing protein [Candidatus Dependentiae bacterium]
MILDIDNKLKNSKVALAESRGYIFSEVKENIINILSLVYSGFENIPVKKGDKVFINPNLLSPRSPDKAVTTHPVFMEAVVEIFKDIGCEISIGDSPAFGKNIKELYEKTGVTEIAKKYNIKEVV